MKIAFKLPSAITLIMIVIVLAAISTWVLPSGQYSKLTNDNNTTFVVSSTSGSVALPFTQHTLDSLSIKVALDKFSNGDVRKPISVPNTYQKEASKPQGIIAILQAPIKGIIESIDIVLFILMIGGFMQVFNNTGAMVAGIQYLAHRMQGREKLLMVVLTTIFSFLGGSYGMDVESVVFYPILVPLFLAAGYDLIVPLAIVFGGAAIGYISSFSNPFSAIIASNTLGINWIDGLYGRLIYFVITIGLFIWYLLRYANKVKQRPELSIAYTVNGITNAMVETNLSNTTAEKPQLTIKTKLLLLLFFLTFTGMILGIVFFDWWTIEMSALFFASALLVAVINRINEKLFVAEFATGMASLLSVALIVGLARGVTIVLNDGFVSDTILFHASNLLEHFPAGVFIVLIMLFYFFFSIPVSSSSGMAVLTMPIIGTLAILLNIPGREIVNAYLFGMGIMFLISPTASLFPALAMVKLSYKAWLKFIMPFIGLLLLVSALFLIVSLQL
jgi:uncharacterized ion transporter superfamily protein YfcC